MSAFVSNFTFLNNTRFGNDVCNISERDVQNNNYGSYGVKNYFEQYCDLKKPVGLATSQPAVFVNGADSSTFCGAGGCNIDVDSDLRIGGQFLKTPIKLGLQQRQFLTVPVLTRGMAKPDVESRLQHGKFTGDKKNCKNLTEKSFKDNDNILVPSLQSSIQNPNNLIEDVAAHRWIRGGLPSRELSRDEE